MVLKERMKLTDGKKIYTLIQPVWETGTNLKLWRVEWNRKKLKPGNCLLYEHHLKQMKLADAL